MTFQLSPAVRNAMASNFESVAGTGPLVRIRTGAPPANTAASRTGTILVSIVLPSDWLSVPTNGQVTKVGTWQGTAIATGTAGYFEVMDSTGATCHGQGTVTLTGNGGDMTVDNTSIATSQTVTVTSFSFTINNG